MAEELKYCEYELPIGSKDGPVTCGRPAHRVSEGRHYCREHFEAVIDEAKSDVVRCAVQCFDEDPDYGLGPSEFRRDQAIEHLKELGYEPGD